MNLETLKKQVLDFPQVPGVYLMKNKSGKLLYVGKATHLRSRVLSYFGKQAEDRYQIRFLMNKVESIETIVTDNDKEALLLESTLIKKHHPRYNIELRDDKSFISLKLTVAHEAPRLLVTRRIRKDGSLYFGPYTSAGACREVVEFIQTHFKLRNCSDHDYRNRVRPCLQYQIKRCDAPCVGLISLEHYQAKVREARLFLEGKSLELKKLADQRMKQAAACENFEEAAQYRDVMRAMETTLEKQKVVRHHGGHRDVWGLFRQGPEIAFCLLPLRAGVMQEGRRFFFKSLEEDAEVLSSFLNQYYQAAHLIPQEILLPLALAECPGLAEALQEHAPQRLHVIHPLRGEKKALLQMAQKNARQAFRQRTEQVHDTQKRLESLQQKLHLKNLPERMECYDISNLQGQASVGSMVTFWQGKAEKSLYRIFKIKSVRGANDFASLYEVLIRRLKRGLEHKDEEKNSPWSLPDLLVMDGGKGQLNAAVEALKDLNISQVDVIALAKSRWSADPEKKLSFEERERSEERVFVPKRKNPMPLKPNSSELLLLMQIRDEAHRFGLTAHRQQRQRKLLASGLDRIPGVGKVRRQKLLKHFGSLKAVQKASTEEIAKTIGIKLELAEQIRQSI